MQEVVSRLVAAIPPSAVQSRRWFAGKSRTIARLRAFDQVVVAADPLLVLALVDVLFADGGADRYALPLLLHSSPRPGAAPDPLASVANVRETLSASEGFATPHYPLALFDHLRRASVLPTARGVVRCSTTPAFGASGPAREARLLIGEQSNTSVVFDDAWIMKSYRRLEPGRGRDLEVGEFFALYSDFPHTPALAGFLEYGAEGAEPVTLATLYRFVPNVGDGWSYVVQRLAAHLAAPREPERLLDDDPRTPLADLVARIERLGVITAAMHRALGARPDVPEFAPEPVGTADLAAWRRDLDRLAAQAFSALRHHTPSATVDPARLQRFLGREAATRRALGALFDSLELAGHRKIQVHGDFHLGQVLVTDDGFVVIDFEGEPARPLAERRARQSPLRDLAGMLRSLDYAAHAALSSLTPERRSPARPPALDCAQALRVAYTRAYVRAIRGSGLLPDAPNDLFRLTRAFEVAKAFYELGYELGHRPDWVGIPLAGLERLLPDE